MDLPKTWFALSREDAAELEKELRRELPAPHQLHGRDLIAIAHRANRKDVLFQTASGGGEFFWVHLTWSVETDPRWPWTVIYRNLADFVERWPREELEDGSTEDID